MANFEKIFQAFENEFNKTPEQREAEAKARREQHDAKTDRRIAERAAELQRHVGRQVRIRVSKTTVITGKVVEVEEVNKGNGGGSSFRVVVEAPNGFSRREVFLKSISSL